MFCLKRLKIVVLACAILLGLGGCLDLDHKITFNPDGAINLDIDARFDSEVKDIAHFIELFGKLGPEAEKIQDGLCGLIQKAAEEKPQPNVTLTARQFDADGKFVCRLSIAFANATDHISEAIQKFPPNSPLQIKLVGERRLLIFLNLSIVPDFTNQAAAFIGEKMREDGRKRLLANPAFPVHPPQPEITDAELWAAYQALMVAATQLSLRDRYVTVVIKAPQILGSSGHFSQTTDEVQFRFSWQEIMEMILYHEKRRDKNFSVVIQY